LVFWVIVLFVAISLLFGVVFEVRLQGMILPNISSLASLVAIVLFTNMDNIRFNLNKLERRFKKFLSAVLPTNNIAISIFLAVIISFWCTFTLLHSSVAILYSLQLLRRIALPSVATVALFRGLATPNERWRGPDGRGVDGNSVNGNGRGGRNSVNIGRLTSYAHTSLVLATIFGLAARLS